MFVISISTDQMLLSVFFDSKDFYEKKKIVQKRENVLFSLIFTKSLAVKVCKKPHSALRKKWKNKNKLFSRKKKNNI